MYKVIISLFLLRPDNHAEKISTSCAMYQLIICYVKKHIIHYNKFIKNFLNFQISIKFYVVIIRPFFINHLGLIRAKKCAIVVRLTPHCSANFRCETPMSSCCKI